MRKTLITLFIIAHTTCFATYYSQCGQDKFVNETYFKNLRDGVFVDIGAHDGISISNTYFFEKELGWTGICVEPIPRIFKQLKKNRNCILVKGCVSDWSGTGQFYMINGYCEMLSGLVNKFDPRHVNRINYEIAASGSQCSYNIINVKCYLFNELMEKHGITHINFLSLDTEGGEFDIISTIDFSRYQIDVITLEDNYGDSRFIPFLEQKGFTFVRSLDQDLVFVNKNFAPSE